MLNLEKELKDKYIAFLDVMGFTNLVDHNKVTNLETYFELILSVLKNIEHDKEEIKSLLISDSIILIAPYNQAGFVQLIIAIKRIQSELLRKKIILRGAVSQGKIYYNKEKNIIVGKGFIRAYKLEKEAIYPRVIIDPSIIKILSTEKTAFLELINGSLSYNGSRHIYFRSSFAAINDDGIFIDYASKLMNKDKLDVDLQCIYDLIVDNLYSQQSLYTKYIWLRDYFLEILILTNHTLSTLIESEKERKEFRQKILYWQDKFERL